ncbi:MAG: DUF1854 domain-containing protein, partial [Planctomycetaceae bacterium]
KVFSGADVAGASGRAAAAGAGTCSIVGAADRAGGATAAGAAADAGSGLPHGSSGTFVTTVRGPHRFKVVHADDLVTQPDGAAFVTDSHGMRYAIPSLAALDPRSRRLLERKA